MAEDTGERICPLSGQFQMCGGYLGPSMHVNSNLAALTLILVWANIVRTQKCLCDRLFIVSQTTTYVFLNLILSFGYKNGLFCGDFGHFANPDGVTIYNNKKIIQKGSSS